MSKATVWFCTCLGKFCHKGDKNLRSLGFKWDHCDPSSGRKAIGNKWVYKIKRDGNDQVEQYRARLVVKGYAQKEGIDFNEIFFPVVRLTTVRIVRIRYYSHIRYYSRIQCYSRIRHYSRETVEAI